MPTYSRVTALNFYGGDTLTYSAYPDYFEYRILVKDPKTKKWDQTSTGPFIDRTIDEVYICIGLHSVDMVSNK